MKFLISLLILPLLLSSIYDKTFSDTDGNEVSMSSFKGKKILIVNTATASDSATQFSDLETLHAMYGDSLVIIAFPSNSFNNEPLEDEAIKSFVNDNYNTHFLVAAKINVTGENIHPVFQWLTSDSLNHVLNTTIQRDFYKFLLDENGELIGIYSNEVNPLDSSVINAITMPAVIINQQESGL